MMMNEISGFEKMVERMPSVIYWVVITSILAFIAWAIGTGIYNVYFHPLAIFPGPIAAAATPFPFVYRVINGRLVNWVQSLHEEYGNVVRIHPDELSFVDSSAWHDIYKTRPPLPRPELTIFRSPDDAVPNLNQTRSTQDHSRMRRIISHGFSESALKEQEYIIQGYTDLLVTQLQGQVKNSQKGSAEVDLSEWYSFTVFDIISDLLFGESFHSLENSEHHPWVKAIRMGFKFGMLLTVFDHFGPLRAIVAWCLPKSLERKAGIYAQWTRERVDKRLAQGTSRRDLMSFILRDNDNNGMSRAEIDANAGLLIIAGSVTSALTCASATWFLLKNPSALERLQREIRGSFSSMKDITIASTGKLPYLRAVILEALRLHPPSAVAMPREVDRPDVVVCGRLIPIGTRVGIPQGPANRLPENFTSPLSFLPERWLDPADARFSADRRAVFEPFQVGPRNCLGKVLAWGEMNLVLAKMIWRFDMVLAPGNPEDWCDQKVFLVYEFLPLLVRITPRDAKM